MRVLLALGTLNLPTDRTVRTHRRSANAASVARETLCTGNELDSAVAQRPTEMTHHRTARLSETSIVRDATSRCAACKEERRGVLDDSASLSRSRCLCTFPLFVPMV